MSYFWFLGFRRWLWKSPCDRMLQPTKRNESSEVGKLMMKPVPFFEVAVIVALAWALLTHS